MRYKIGVSFFASLLISGVAFGAIGLPSSIITSEYLHKKYSDGKITILVIPGHINSKATGSSFRGIKESDLTKDLAGELIGYLKSDPKFTVFTFDDVAVYLEYPDYIKAFRKEAYQNSKTLVKKGYVEPNQAVSHVSIPSDDSLILYAINKWARDHNIDIVLHAHFNDYPRKYQSLAGKYTGFAVYIPEKQLPNHKSSAEIGSYVQDALSKYFPVSDYPPESSGLVGDQDLIAVGAPSAFYGVAMLVEYSYLYESQLVNKEVRPAAIKEMAYQTYRGIKKFFDEPAVKNMEEFSGLPYQWKNYLREGFRGREDVYALQEALTREGVYPPLDETKNKRRTSRDCPINGNFGGCTRKSLMEFQKKYDIQMSGFAGEKTLGKLNELYSKQ